ncbi:Outer membrane efflux protein BepC [Zhongshania aliphaticivorans]|uniref:Outer membrane efflux protein BepC n=1 Tax=Zhongshania aliphaticivorans TaxID=1470434 RepID=A0A5S9PXR2_9GAMM|nr:TolC family outer membrane protein [Zhongshania aliphaticivorans]CAA0092120.1 Outer membrane efflux protein BepC [Zhongshania aliphaticivorans]CAA0109244.1 Outer membrane efflux protein BepC [Zhongshania aliphaticivorans]
MNLESPSRQRFLCLARLDLLVVGLLFSLLSTFAVAEKDTLRSAVLDTLDSNPEINSQLEAFFASQQDVRAVYGGYLPTVDLDVSVGEGNRSFDNRGSYSRNYAEISLTQMLFDGFRVRNNLAQAKHTSRSLYYDALNAAETKGLEAAQAYLDVLRYRKLVALAQLNLDRHLRVRENVTERARSGVGNRADQQQIEGRVSLARSNLMTEVANLQSVTARFQRLVGRLPLKDMAVFSLTDGPIPDSLDQVLNTSYANNPALYSAFESARSAEASLGTTKSNRYPTIELGVRQGVYKNNNSFDARTDPDPYGGDRIVELRMNYNLFNGGSDRAAERAAYRRMNQALSLRDKACVDLRQTATIAYTDILNIDTRISALAAHQVASRNVHEAYRQQFDIGRRSLLDVLDSENEAYQADRAYVAGLHDLQLAKLRTLQSMGLLLSTLSLSSDQIPTLEDALAEAAAPEDSRYCSSYIDAQLDMVNYDKPASEPLTESIALSGDALFDTGSAELKPQALGSLRSLVEKALSYGVTLTSVSIIGHTDSTGSDELNRNLSLARAIAVRDFLIKEGITASIMTASGVGASQPVASNASASGRLKNRRVDLLIQRSE